MKRTLITATPPTPNGDLHLGHLSGPYVAADVYKRYLRAQGTEAFFVCGGDDHQSFVDVKASQLGQSPAELSGHFNREILSSLAGVQAPTDCWVVPLESKSHDAFVLAFFKKLYDEGKIVAKKSPAPWCESCDRYLFEAHVGGRCPYCGEASDGNVCEACARPNQCVDLIDPRCKHCGAAPALRDLERLYFPLSRYHEDLERYYGEVAMSPHLAELCARMLEDGLPDIPVSHLSPWGLPVPAPGFEGQTIYAWFEMAPGYLSATRELLQNRGEDGAWESFWCDEGGEVVQFFGYDNGYFHAVLFPAELIAFDRRIRLPRAFVVNEFYLLEGEKFSTSRNHVVWGKEALAHLSADAVRFYLAYDRPESEQSDFRLSEFCSTVGSELLGQWRGWLDELRQRFGASGGRTVPGVAPLTGSQRFFLEELDRLRRAGARAYEAPTFSLQRAARVLCELVWSSRRFGRAEAYQSGARRGTALALELTAAALLARMSAPLLPDFGERLGRELELEALKNGDGWPSASVEPLPQGHPVSFSGQDYFAGVEEGLQSLSESRRSAPMAAAV